MRDFGERRDIRTNPLAGARVVNGTKLISKMFLYVGCFFFIALVNQPAQVHGNPVSLKFFPFGPQHDDNLLTKDVDDVSSPEVRLKTPVMFYGTQYTGIYVSLLKCKTKICMYLA